MSESILLKLSSKSCSAEGIYDLEKKTLVVKKGAVVSDTVSHGGTFKSGDKIEEQRKKYVSTNRE